MNKQKHMGHSILNGWPFTILNIHNSQHDWPLLEKTQCKTQHKIKQENLTGRTSWLEMQIPAERDPKNVTSIAWEMPAAIKERKSTIHTNTWRWRAPLHHGTGSSILPAHTLIRSTVRYMSTSTWIWGNLDNYTGYALPARGNAEHILTAVIQRRSELVPISRIWEQKVFPFMRAAEYYRPPNFVGELSRWTARDTFLCKVHRQNCNVVET